MYAQTSFELLETRRLFSADLVADFTGFHPRDSVVLNGESYFLADDPVHGKELWKSDGTAAGTKLVKDIVPGRDFDEIDNLCRVGDHILFFVDDYEGSTIALWRTDGTSEGTVLVKEVEDGNGVKAAPVVVGGRMLWTDSVEDSSNPGQHEAHLWSSDGTAEGTGILMVGTNGVGFVPVAVSDHHAVIFSSDYNVWSTDGTEAGTFALTPPGGTQWTLGESSATLNGELIFEGNGQLWKTDGTQEGTQFVSDDGGSGFMRLGDNKLLYTAYLDHANWLVVTDGTTEGTQRILNTEKLNGLGMSGATVGNKRFMFTSRANGKGQATFDIWTSDGTTAGTVKAATIENILWTGQSVALGDKLFFFVDAYNPLWTSANHAQWQLWQSDGTQAGTKMVRAFPVDKGHKLKVVGDQVAVYGTSYGSGDDSGDDVIVFLVDSTIATEPLQSAVNLNAGTLSVLGTKSADNIQINRDPRDNSRLIVTINGVKKAFLASHVKNINVYGYAGNDKINFDEEFGTIIASARIWGGDGDDDIHTGSGRDSIDGGNGSDAISSGNGNDAVNGDAGNDIINGGNGNDSANGGNGVDSVIGGKGNDVLAGGDDGASDHLDGGVGADVIFGHAVYDIFFAGKHDEDPLDSVLLS